MRPYTFFYVFFIIISACKPALNIPEQAPSAVLASPKQFDHLIPPEVLLDSGYRTMDSTCFNRFFEQWEAIQTPPVVKEGDTAKAFQEVWSLFFQMFRHPEKKFAVFRANESMPVYGARYLKIKNRLPCNIDLRAVDSSIFIPGIEGEGVLYPLPAYEKAISDFAFKRDTLVFYTANTRYNLQWLELGRLAMIRRYVPLSWEGWSTFACEYALSITSITLNTELTEAHIRWAIHAHDTYGDGYAWKKNGKWEIRFINPNPFGYNLPPIGNYIHGIR